MFKLFRFLLVLGIGFVAGRAYSIHANMWTMAEGLLGMLLFVIAPMALMIHALDRFTEWVRERRLRNRLQD
jgi:hypothetical protein